MLTRLHYQLIVEAAEGNLSLEDQRAFVAQPIPDQVARIQEIIKAADLFLPETAGAEYIDCLQVLSKPAGAMITWPKQPAPKTFPELTMRWQEEYMKVSGMAAKMSHADVASAGTRNWIISEAVSETLGIAGMVEHIGGRSISVEDQTMQLFIAAVLEALKMSRPDWHSADGELLAVLPDGVNGKSEERLDYEAAAQLRRHKREAAAKAAAARKVKHINDTQIRRAELFAGWDTSVSVRALDIKKHVDALSLAEFDAAKANANGIVIVLAEQLNLGAETVPLFSDYVLDMVRKRLPNWFKETEDGSIRFRRAPQIDKPKGLDRPTRTLRKLLAKLIEKHGEDVVRQNLDGICGRLGA